MIHASGVTLLLFAGALAAQAPGAETRAGETGGAAASDPAAGAAGAAGREVARLREMCLSGQTAEAIRQAERELASSPDDVELHVLLANCLVKGLADRQSGAPPGAPRGAGDAEEPLAKAIGHLDRAVEIAPQRRDLWLGLCELHRRAGDLAALLRCVEEAAGRFPGNLAFAKGLRDNARDYVATQDYTSAAALLAPIAKHNPSDVMTLLALGRSQYLAGQPSEGIATTEAALRLASGDAAALFQRAELAAFEGDFKTAAEHFSLVLKGDPSRADATLGMVTSLHPIDRAAALRIARRAENSWRNARAVSRPKGAAPGAVHQVLQVLTPAQPSAYDIVRVGQSLAMGGMDAAALGEVAAALAAEPEMPDALYLKAGILVRQGQHDRAAAALLEALRTVEQQPGRAAGVTRDELLAMLGQTRFRMSDFSGSLDAYGKISQPDAYAFQMAMANDRLGLHAEAARLLRLVEKKGTDPVQVEEAKRILASPPYAQLP